MKLVAYNHGFGGFDLSSLAKQKFVERKVKKGVSIEKAFKILNEVELNTEKYRDDEDLTAVIKELEEKASGRFGSIKLAHIPDDTDFKISDYDGVEEIYYGYDLHTVSSNGLDN